jgi:erythromycin esterase-like protein
MFRGGVEGWNLRDQHMAETLEELVAHPERTSGATKVAVWEHKLASRRRARDGGRAGGPAERRAAGARAPRRRRASRRLHDLHRLCDGGIGLGRSGGAQARPPCPSRRLGGAVHEQEPSAFIVDARELHGRRLERAIGVIYRPETERISHYFHARIGAQFDAVIHLDETTAVEPLERTSEWEAGDLPETYPFGVWAPA